ncbi:MAG TPA: hypothetical protein VMM93_03160 [Vicinamibacterales bacterium]|nr:hypothetical protein [Vicinamibacterales bacterium]
MEQRPLRVGAIVDDYCPRERRITSHAIVAIVGDVIRQTRCQACDSDHAYKEAKVPRRRKKDESEALYEQVLSDVTGTLVPPRPADAAPVPVSASAAEPHAGPDDEEPTPGERGDDQAASQDAAPGEDLWTGHRRLIRASLPRSDNEPPPPRPIPEFTMHQRQRGNGFRPRGWSGDSQGNNSQGNGGQGRGGQSPGGGRHRPSGGRPGGSRGGGRRGR